MKHTLSIYGCGGAGSNIVQHYVDLPQDPERPLYPKTTLNLLDTSDSNLTKSKNKVNHFVVPGLEGAGKHRTKAYDGVETHIVNILNDHKPGQFNIVVYSASGG
jgi:hypothetical protein